MKKNVSETTNQLKLIGSLCVMALITAMAVPHKSETQNATVYHKGARIHLPEDIDCAKTGDTLFVLSASPPQNGQREITVGCRLNHTTISKRFNLKN